MKAKKGNYPMDFGSTGYDRMPRPEADPPEHPVPQEDAIPHDDPPPARDAEFWSRRKSVIAEYSQDAFQQRTPLERNLALINADLMALLAHVNEPLERALAQTSDPIDRLKLLQTMLPEQCKLTREIRALSEMQTRAERQRYDEELAWLRNQQRRTSSGDGATKKPR